MIAKKVIVAGVLILAMFGGSASAGAATWRVPSRRFATIQAAVDDPAVLDGDTIVVRRGLRAGAVVTKRLLIKGRPGAVINQHPPGAELYQGEYEVGFWFPGNGAGSGSLIRGFTFKGIPFPVYSAGADGVRVIRNRMVKPIQGVTNWGGSGWKVKYNAIRNLLFDNGGAIGVFIGDFEGTPDGVNDNRVVGNRIDGTLIGSANDDGGYWGSGVAIYADFRWGAPGAVRMANNRVLSNTIAVRDTVQPVLVRVVGVEVAEADNPIPDDYVIRANVVNLNNLAGTRVALYLSPIELAGLNTIQGYPRPASLEALSAGANDREVRIAPFR